MRGKWTCEFNSKKRHDNRHIETIRNLREAFIALRPELEGRISVNSPKAPGEGHRVTFGIK